MRKRGQVTIFIIIAIIIVASTILFFIFRGKLGILESQANDPTYLFIESCIEDTGKDAIYFISRNGGYFFSPAASTSEGIPYYYYNGKNYMPSIERIEEEISSYIEGTLSYCTEEFVDFPEFNITEGKIKAKTTIKDEKIILEIEYPVTIKKGKTTIRLKNFRDIIILARVGTIYDSIKEMMQEQTDEGKICLSCISTIANREGFTVDMIGTQEDIIFTIKDEYSKIKGIPLEFKFANKY